MTARPFPRTFESTRRFETSVRRAGPLTVLSIALATLVTTGAAAQGKMSPYMPDADAPRSDVPEAYRWDLRPLWESGDAWEQARNEVEAGLVAITACEGHLHESAAALRACLDTKYDLQKKLERLWVYASSDFSVDRQIDAAQARLDRIKLLGTAFDNTASFIEPELLRLDEARLRAWMADDDTLAIYRHELDDLLRRKAHILSPEAETVLALSGDLRGGPYAMLNALQQDIEFPEITDEDGKTVRLAFANFPRYRGSKVRSVRKEAVEKFFATLAGRQRSFAASLDMGVKRDIYVARARKYHTALEASLDSDSVPVAVFDMLLQTMADNLPRTLHRYIELRRKVLGVDKIHYYDLYAPLMPSMSKTVPYAEAVRIIAASLRPLGDEYLAVLTKGMALEQGWVDLYPNKGKRSGAYQTDAYDVHPFVFLNYMDELDDAFTAAHEFGHAMHSNLANGSQAYPNASPPIFLAEIASTFNEELLLNDLLAAAKTREEKLALLTKRLENIRQTAFRQIMFAEFERDIHAEVEGGGALTAERTNEIYDALIRKYYGPEFVIEENDKIEWTYVPHFYYNFYVYKYATGLMSSIALARRVLSGEPGAVDAYLGLLKAGGSDYPLELLKTAGVDLTKPDAIQETFDLFAETLSQFEALL